MVTLRTVERYQCFEPKFVAIFSTKLCTVTYITYSTLVIRALTFSHTWVHICQTTHTVSENAVVFIVNCHVNLTSHRIITKDRI